MCCGCPVNITFDGRLLWFDGVEGKRGLTSTGLFVVVFVCLFLFVFVSFLLLCVFLFFFLFLFFFGGGGGQAIFSILD